MPRKSQRITSDMDNTYSQQHMAAMDFPTTFGNEKIPSSFPAPQSMTNLSQNINDQFAQNNSAYFNYNNMSQSHFSNRTFSPQVKQYQSQPSQNHDYLPKEHSMMASPNNSTSGNAHHSPHSQKPSGGSRSQNVMPYLRNDYNSGGSVPSPSKVGIGNQTCTVLQQPRLIETRQCSRPQSSHSPASSNTSSIDSLSRHGARKSPPQPTSASLQPQQHASSSTQSLPTGHSPAATPSTMNGWITNCTGLPRDINASPASLLPKTCASNSVRSQGHMAASRSVRTNFTSSSSPPTMYQHPYTNNSGTPQNTYRSDTTQQSRQPRQNGSGLASSSSQDHSSGQGKKRPAPDASEDTISPSKKLVTNTNNAIQVQIQQIRPQASSVPELQAQLCAQQQAPQQAYVGISSQNQQKIAAHWQATETMKLKKQRELEAQQKAAAEKQHCESQKARLEQQQRDATEKRQQALRAKEEAMERQRLANEESERVREAEKQCVESARRVARKNELCRDPSGLFRHYREYIEIFPLCVGEYKSQYHIKLLANRPPPLDPNSDLAFAIQYAYDNWEFYHEYPRDTQMCAQLQREKLAKTEALTQGIRAATAKK